MSDDNPIKRWTAKRKASVVMDIFKGKTTVAEVARQHDLTVSEVDGWIDEAQRNMENGFKARPKDIREQYESDLRETKEALGEAHLQIYALKNVWSAPVMQGPSYMTGQDCANVSDLLMGYRVMARAMMEIRAYRS